MLGVAGPHPDPADPVVADDLEWGGVVQEHDSPAVRVHRRREVAVRGGLGVLGGRGIVVVSSWSHVAV